jgi:phenylacetate-CoA ligase
LKLWARWGYGSEKDDKKERKGDMNLYSNLVRRVIHPAWLMKDGRLAVLRYLKEFEASQFMPVTSIREAQLQKILKMVRHSYDNCEFYRERLDRQGVRPSEIRDFRDYQKIPVLTKKEIQENAGKMRAKIYSSEELVPNRTGGSTGSPIQFYHDRERLLSMWASSIRHDSWAGYKIGDKLAGIWGARMDLSGGQRIKKKIRNLLLDRSIVLDSSSLTDEKMKNFVDELREFQPRTILAYAKAMYFFALYCRDNGIKDIQPHSIITSAEVLEEEERRTIEEVFDCKVFNRYGCREVSVIASECAEHQGLHLNSETLYVEFVDQKGDPVGPGEAGNIVITDLLNFGMPFIRYKIEDVGTPDDHQCPCGRGLPLMKMVAGRTTDFLKTTKGVSVSGSALTIYLITSVPGIRQAQIIQDKVDHLTFKVVAGREFLESGTRTFREKVSEFFGEEMRYDIQYVEEIPKEKSGKYRFSVSLLKDAGTT